MYKLIVCAAVLMVCLIVGCDDTSSAKDNDEKKSAAVDTVYVFNKDTVYSVDSLIIRDSLVTRDSIFLKDTVVYIDTLILLDSIYSIVQDDTSCEIEDQDSTVLVTCDGKSFTLYKATCGNNPFDPEKSICHEGTIFNLATLDTCGEKLFDNTTHFCSGDTVVSELCNGKDYDPATRVCLDGVIWGLCEYSGILYDPAIEFCFLIFDNEQERSSYGAAKLCKGETYDVDSLFCFEDSLYNTCGLTIEGRYNPKTEFCQNGRAYPLCEGIAYEAKDSACVDGVVVGGCYGKPYDPKTQFCAEMAVYDLCQGNTYDVKNQRCIDDVLYAKCGSKWYDVSIQFCQPHGEDGYSQIFYEICDLCGGEEFFYSEFCYDGVVLKKCGGREYNPNALFCSADTLRALCGSETYNTYGKFCYEDKIYTLCNGKRYNPETEFCHRGLDGAAVVPLCNGMEYGRNEECVDGQVTAVK